MDEYKHRVADMFEHGWRSYMNYAFPADLLLPLSCRGDDGKAFGGYAMTLIDSLDALVVFNKTLDFIDAVKYLQNVENIWDLDRNVSVFETNIRTVGGLLSAHLLEKEFMFLGSDYHDELLHLATELGYRLIPAFNTPTDLPFGTVNLNYGVPRGETPIVATAGAGTFLLEFGILSRFTGDLYFEEIAKRSLYSLFEKRTSKGLFGAHIDVETGKWTDDTSGVGNYIDSFFEYLLKGSILFGEPELETMFHNAYDSIIRYLKNGNLWTRSSCTTGAQRSTNAIVDSLSAFFAGLQVLVGDIEMADAFALELVQIWKKYRFIPELYFHDDSLIEERSGYPLRPELAESLWYLYRATKDPKYIDGAKAMVDSLSLIRVLCGFANVKSVIDLALDDRMESFFLAETLKYLYLIFDEENFVNHGNYVFNTEAHIFSRDFIYENQLYSSFPRQKNLYKRFNPIFAKFTEGFEKPIIHHTYELSSNRKSFIGKGAFQLNQNGLPIALSQIPLGDLAFHLKDELNREISDIKSRNTAPIDPESNLNASIFVLIENPLFHICKSDFQQNSTPIDNHLQAIAI
jgi:mannosidase alpha-like ER degradation enhancer 2